MSSPNLHGNYFHSRRQSSLESTALSLQSVDHDVARAQRQRDEDPVFSFETTPRDGVTEAKSTEKGHAISIQSQSPSQSRRESTVRKSDDIFPLSVSQPGTEFRPAFRDPFDENYSMLPTMSNRASSDVYRKSSYPPPTGTREITAHQPARNFSRPSYAPCNEKLVRIPDPSRFPRIEEAARRPSLLLRRKSSALSVQSQYPQIADPKDPARRLSSRNLFTQRTVFFGTIILLNITCLTVALAVGTGLWVFIFILIIKSKDVLSSLLAPICMVGQSIYHWFKPRAEVPQKWILSLIPAYSETEEQIVKCIFSLRDNGTAPHKQLMCVLLDGKPRDIQSKFTEHIASIERPYVSFKHKKGELMIHIGFLEDIPVIVIEKKRNAGKKDSLILGHDLFNYPRQNVPLYTKLLREEIWESVLPDLLDGEDFKGFDMIFCTDADSIIHKGALASLTNALARDENSIAACGLVLVELEPGFEWSVWNLYQQFQYSFGQYVRRRAEHFWGKVTCLPGCITMIRVRPECAGAIEKYAEAVTSLPVIKHQVQYLGTDRRLTYSLLSQDKKLTTLFVPEAVSETVAPQSLKHYLSQRRRWGSNAYFNNYFYMTGTNMIWITRLAAFVDILRLSMVYYRFANTIMLFYNIGIMASRGTFNVVQIVPLLAVSQIPTLWYAINVIIVKELRVRAHKLVLGAIINKFIAPFISMTVFYNVAKNVGSQVWGISGITATTATAATAAAAATTAANAAATAAAAAAAAAAAVTATINAATATAGMANSPLLPLYNEPGTTVPLDEVVVEGQEDEITPVARSREESLSSQPWHRGSVSSQYNPRGSVSSQQHRRGSFSSQPLRRDSVSVQPLRRASIASLPAADLLALRTSISEASTAVLHRGSISSLSPADLRAIRASISAASAAADAAASAAATAAEAANTATDAAAAATVAVAATASSTGTDPDLLQNEQFMARPPPAESRPIWR